MGPEVVDDVCRSDAADYRVRVGGLHQLTCCWVVFPKSKFVGRVHVKEMYTEACGQLFETQFDVWYSRYSLQNLFGPFLPHCPSEAVGLQLIKACDAPLEGFFAGSSYCLPLEQYDKWRSILHD